MLTVLFQEAIDPFRFRPQVLTILLWAVVSLSVQFSKSFQTYLAQSHVYATHSVSSLGLVWLFISSVLRVCGLLFSVRSTYSAALSLRSLQYSWFIGPPFLCVWGQTAEGQKERKSIKGSPYPTETTASLIGKEGSCYSRVATAATIGLFQAGPHENRKKERKRNQSVSIYFLEFSRTPFPILQARTKLGFPLELSVHIKVCFQMLGCILSTPRDTARKRNPKKEKEILNSPLILWYVEFWPSSPALLLLFTFQSLQIAAPRFYNYLPVGIRQCVSSILSKMELSLQIFFK